MIYPRDDKLQAVIGAFTKEGKWDLALNVFQNMLNRGLKPNLIACNALMNYLYYFFYFCINCNLH